MADEGKALAADLLLAYRHGNQLAFDDLIAKAGTDERSGYLIGALCWIANEGVRRSHLPAAADQVLRHLARRAPDPESARDVLTDEEGAPETALLLTAVACEDTETVRELVRSTPDTTFLLGKLLMAFALLLPEVREGAFEEVVALLREQGTDS